MSVESASNCLEKLSKWKGKFKGTLGSSHNALKWDIPKMLQHLHSVYKYTGSKLHQM